MERETMHKMLRDMMLSRIFEERAAEEYSKGNVVGFLHLYPGEEAVAAGVINAAGPADYIVSTYREHAHALVRGTPPRQVMAELFGRATGTCHGKGGSLHIADFSVGMLGANGVVAAGLTIAVGAAHALKLKGERRVVVCFFGDGATNRGPFLESLNWAKLFELPVLFVCEDNGFAAMTRTRAVSAGPGPEARAESLGIQARAVDGNDVAAVDESAAELLARVRAGQGPQFLLARTYRLKGHTASDAALYRAAAELEAKKADDPIKRCGEILGLNGVAEARLAALAAEARGEIAAAVEAARAAPWPAAELAWADVQDVGAGRWR